MAVSLLVLQTDSSPVSSGWQMRGEDTAKLELQLLQLRPQVSPNGFKVFPTSKFLIPNHKRVFSHQMSVSYPGHVVVPAVTVLVPDSDHQALALQNKLLVANLG